MRQAELPILNCHIQEYIVSILCGSSSVCKDVNHQDGSIYLDSHANMIVCRKYAYILSKSGLTAEVDAFVKECSLLKILIVDTSVII